MNAVNPFGGSRSRSKLRDGLNKTRAEAALPAVLCYAAATSSQASAEREENRMANVVMWV